MSETNIEPKFLDPLFQRVVDRVSVFYERFPRIFSFVMVVVVAFHHGWGVFPNSVWIMSIVASFPELPLLDPLAQYNFFSIGPYLALHLLSIDDPQIVVKIGFVGVALITYVMYLVSEKSKEQNLAFAVFLTSPIFMILLSWIGSYDLFTVACIVAVMYTRKPVIALVAGALVSWTNFEQFVFCLLIVNLAFSTGDVCRRKNFLISFFSASTSYLIIKFYLASNGVEIVRLTGLFKLLEDPTFFSKTLQVLPLTLFSIFSVSIILTYYWTKVCQPTLVQKLRLLIASCLVLCLSLISLDQTRIGAILIFPLCLAISEAIAAATTIEYQKRIKMLLISNTLVFPAFFIWSSTVHLAGWGNLSLQI